MNTLNIRSLICVICAFIFLSISSSTIAQICSSDPNTAIDDGFGSTGAGTPASIDIDVPAFFTNAITDLTFDLRIDHTFVGDLIVTLQSPAGTTVTLMDRPGRPPATFGCGQDNVDANFDDASAIDVEDECSGTGAAIQGILNPQGTLSDFDGEIPAGTWTLTVTDNAGQDTGTIIAGSNCLDLTTVPVVLSSFESRQRGQRVVSRWQTASEAFNLGFNLWGNINGDWTQLNQRLIRSGAVDSVEPLNYRRSININRMPSPPTEIGISSVSSSGFEEFYGPFEIGERYGEITVPKPIDWSAQRDKHRQAMQQAGFEYRHGRWRKISRHGQRIANYLQERFPDAWLRIEQDGVYRVTHEELLTNGIDLSRLPIWRIALSQRGKAVARRVKGSTRRPWQFGPGAEITFFAQTPKGALQRYADFSNVRVSTDASLVHSASQQRHQRLSSMDDVSSFHIKRVSFGQPKGYSFIVPGDNPWYDEVIFAAGSTASKKMVFEVGPQGLLDKPVQIRMNLMGGTSFENLDNDGDGVVEPDHHLKVYLNREQFSEPVYEGFAEMVDPIAINTTAQGQLLIGENVLEVEVIPDNGHNLDAAYFLNAELDYQATNETVDERAELRLDIQHEWVSIPDNNAQVQRIFVSDSAGNFRELRGQRKNGQLLFRVPPAIGESTDRTVWLARSDNNLLSVAELSPAAIVDPEDLDLRDVDYVIVAHPSLIGEKLGHYAEQQRELGRNTKVVSTFDIFAQYSEGLPTPQAIASYLRQAAQGTADRAPATFTHVLLVGGHTYNYLGFNVSNDERPINLIPSFYRNGAETINRQIPTAVPFVDFDFDGAPDRAIGRWPVRDLEQLALVVDKTMAWHRQGSHKDNQQALLIAQKDEDLNNFSASIERVNDVIGHTSNPWLEPEKVIVSEILADDNVPADRKINTARDRLVDGINQGPALTIYSGHASPTTWGRENLLTTSVVDRFTNTGTPSLIVPLACYTTYYETPKIKSLSERLFSDNAAGAVGLTGPALLSYNSDNERFAKQLLRLMTQQGHDLGTAVMLAKQAIKHGGPRRQTVIDNWVTLADPTLSFGLPAVIEEPEVENESRKAR